jgi:ABC-type phosphate/phosphonate transport system substrate-binding protein
MLSRRYKHVGLGLILAATLGLAPNLRAEAPKPDMKIGVVESMFRDIPPKGVEVVLQKFTDLIQMQTGYKVKIEIAGDAIALGDGLASGKYQMGVFNGFEFAWAREKSTGLHPLLIAVSRERDVSAHLVVRNDKNVQSIKDLKAKVLAQPWRCREFARLFLERRCLATVNALPNDVFDSIVEAPTGEEALDMVVNKDADAVIIDSVGLNQYKIGHPAEAAKLKDLEFSKAFPAGVLAFNKDALPQKQIDTFTKGMLNANQSAKGKDMMKFCGVTSFESIPENYETLLQYVLKEYPAIAPQAVTTPETEPVKEPAEVKEK